MKPSWYIIISCLLAPAAWPAEKPVPKQLAEARALFAKGAYPQSAALAEKITGESKEISSQVALHLAATYTKMQDFNRALPHYRKALALGNGAPELNYDFGQALFATRNLKEAEAEFKKSIVKQFKMAASAYYVAYIRQLLEDRPGATDFYQRIQRLNSDHDKVKQPALYQLAEMEQEAAAAEQSKAKRLRLLEKRVLPLYERAADFESGTPTHEQAKSKISELESELSSVVERMANGNPIPKKPYTLKLSQDFTYDSNVITEAEGALLQVSDKDSLISRTAVFALYQFNWRRRFSFVPELSTSLSLHSRRGTPRVYQNDNIVVAPALRSKWEHQSKGKPATGLFDIEYNLMLRDYEQQHSFPYYTRSINFSLGERVTWFDTGSTTLKVAIKFAENYNPDRNALSPLFSFQQNVKIFGKYDLQNTVSAEFMRARDDNNDEKNYRFRHSTSIPQLFEKVDFLPSFSLTFKDTMKQKALRGTEVLVNPALTFTRDIGPIEGSFDYAYSKNYSKSKDQYQYSKHELKVGGSYRF